MKTLGKYHTRLTKVNRSGFTLIEMIIVATLLSIMSAMATISIFTAMEEARKKATTAECRQVATAVSFANTDLGFFPKLCFLLYSYDNLMSTITGAQQIPTAQFEYHGMLVNNLTQRLMKNWTRSSPYLAGNFKHQVEMRLPGATGNAYRWPGDQWGNPYVLYLMKSDLNAATGRLQPKFIEGAGEQPDYFAAVVSYGRNAVPGMTSKLTTQEASENPAYLNQRLYTGPVKGPFTALQTSDYTDTVKILAALLNIDGAGNTIPVNEDAPRIREAGSDDIVVEF